MKKDFIISTELGNIQKSIDRIRNIREPGVAEKYEDEIYLTQDDAAKFLRITVTTLIKYRNQGKIPYKAIGKRVLYKKQDLYNLS